MNTAGENYLAAGAAAVAAGAVGSGGNGWPSGTIVTLLIRTGVTGLSFAFFSTRAIDCTTSTECGSH
jgi:hypothetical protein